jgi:hypothetical protein
MGTITTINPEGEVGTTGFGASDFGAEPFGYDGAIGAIGIQFNAASVRALGVQFNATIYNTNAIRILCQFDSRGDSATVGGGNNAWGNPLGTGQNWQTNSARAAEEDFDINNVNTDVVEFTYRTVDTVKTNIQLDCDAEGLIQPDTFALLNHNLTASASVTITGSNNSNMSAPVFTANMETTLDNMYYILPVLSFPIPQARYWRIGIEDSTNPAAYLEVGTIIFGGASIFQGECIVTPIPFQLRDFADKVLTEGFTNVANARAQRRNVSLSFRSLNYLGNNFTKIREVITDARTILKCLWVPTPSETDQTITDRFAVFGKIAGIPTESHNAVSDTADYVDLTIEVDESL